MWVCLWQGKCTHTHMCICACMCVHACGSHRSTAGVSPSHCPSYFSKHGSSLNLELTVDRSAGQQIAGIFRLCLPSAGTAGAYRLSRLLMWVLGIQTQDLMLSCQELCELPSYLAPECPYFLRWKGTSLFICAYAVENRTKTSYTVGK